MNKNIVRLADEGNVSALTKTLAEVQLEELGEILEERALEEKADTVSFIRAVLKGSSCNTSDGLKRTMYMYKQTIKLLNNGEITNKVSTDIVGFLLMELDALPGKALAELADVFLDAIKEGSVSGKSLELLPKVLSAVAAKESVPLTTDCGGEMSGPEYKRQILNSLCSSRWDSQCVIHLAAMFRDVPMSSEELRFVIDKLQRMFKELDLQELPPLVYQLLLLSTKGHKNLVLQGVLSFFNEQDEACREEEKAQNHDGVQSISKEQLRHMEGTIILHITFAIKQDQNLGKELIKFLKASQSSPGKILTPFTVALSLSVAQIHRFEETVFDILKSSILRSFKDEERQRQSKWIKENIPECFKVQDFILETVQNSLFGWDHVTQGLVQLGFLLMDSYGPRVFETHALEHLSPTQQACELGSKVLLNTFKGHEMVRAEILEQILNRVVTKATTPVGHFINLLSSTVRSAPHVLLESLPKVKEALDYLSFLPPRTAEGLLKALQPLMKISLSLRDSLILVLRKAMFSRQVDARKIAVTGFLQLLKHFKVLGSGGLGSSQASSQASVSFSQCSQVQVDVHIRGGAGNEALCLEILGNLRRCFTQQSDVRILLYEGLYDVMCHNPQLRQPILDALYVQFQKYYETEDDVTPPIKLDPCLSASGEQVFLAEPLAHLLSALQHCTLWCGDHTSEEDDDQDNVEHLFNEVEDLLQSLTRRMIKSEMEDFELDKSADFSPTTSVGMKNSFLANLVLGVCELLLEFTFTEGEFSTQSIEEVTQLFAVYHQLEDILKEKSVVQGKKSRPWGSKQQSSSTSLLSLGCVAQLCTALFSDLTPSHQQGLMPLRSVADFVRYVLNVTLQKLKQISESGTCSGPRGRNKEHIYKQCHSIARVFLKHVSGNSCINDDRVKKDKSKKLSSLCLEGLCIVVNIVCCHYKDKLSHFLAIIDLSGESRSDQIDQDDEQEHIYSTIKIFQQLIISIISSDTQDSDISVKDTHTLINVISLLTHHLDPDSQQFAHLQCWVQRICKEHNVDDMTLSKALVTLLFSLTFQSKTGTSMIREMAQDIHSQLGDVDEEIEVENRTHFAIVNPRTAAPTIALIVVNQMDKILDELDWTMSKIRGDLAVTQSTPSNAKMPDSPDNTQRTTLESAVCVRLTGLVMALHELSQSALPEGPCTESTVKVLTKLYVTLATCGKYYMALYNQRLGHLPPKFEKLVKLTGTHLSQQVYAMITYIQAVQTQSLQEMAASSKGKAKDKKRAQNMAGKAKVMKEMKSIPNLIYAIEQYEKFLIQLSKKSKINLMEHFKRSTARDFRINGATLEAALRDDPSDEEDEDGSESESEEPPKKKGKNEEGKPRGGKMSLKQKKAAKQALAVPNN
ncbi:Fanconi anemia group I protein-like [Actinia tenebrosa]|uniref:Fanconi anemia group I protein-like n=1 Tax=Actinia tenebrosa TaxID=6105 RepID=A0A6P8HNL4_ACTTE|nr:Fanconi anemia group I protein-like [Actinia tenebrosa]